MGVDAEVEVDSVGCRESLPMMIDGIFRTWDVCSFPPYLADRCRSVKLLNKILLVDSESNRLVILIVV